MVVALVLIFLAWLVVIAAVYTMQRLASVDSKRRITIVLATAIVSGLVFLGIAWLLINERARMDKQAELERKGSPRAYLVPANEPSPLSRCAKKSPDEIAIYFGSSSMYTTGDELRFIKSETEPLLTAKRTASGILVNLKLFDKNGNQIAMISDNKFIGKIPDNLDVKYPDAHSIDIFDKNDDKLIFHIRYLNPQAIEILGRFYYPKKKYPLDINEERILLGNAVIIDTCLKNNVYALAL